MRALLLVAAVSALLAQSPSFEVATVKPAPPADFHGMRVGASGGPGTSDPGRWRAENMTLQDLILLAYDLKPFQLSGPSWLPGDRFEIQAKVPEGATAGQLKQMVRGLLAERFGLVAHRERKEANGYRLIVAKGGPKLARSRPREPGAGTPTLGAPKMGADGFPEVSPGVPVMLAAGPRVLRQSVGENMETLASMLARQLGKPVTDATGLEGEFDYLLKWDRGIAGLPGHSGPATRPPEDVGPNLMTALQDQLGLKLEPARGNMEILVIERLEKTPTGN